MFANTDPDFPTLVAAILARGHVSTGEVATLRARIFPDGIVSPADAAALFALHGGTHGNHPTWHGLFVEALTDHFVWQTQPRGSIDEAGAQTLFAATTRNGHVESRGELELLVNVCHWALGCPDSLRAAALAEVRHSVLGGGEGASNPLRRTRIIERTDVAIVSKLICPPGMVGSLRVTREAADLLFDLNAVSIGAENDPGWRELFVRGVLSHLMFPHGEPKLPGLGEAARRELWVAERRGVEGLIGGIPGEAISGGPVQSWRDVDLFGEAAPAEEAGALTDTRPRGVIDAGEAAWLLDRIGRDGPVHDNEIALLRAIVGTATGIYASLRPLLARAGVEPVSWKRGVAVERRSAA